MASKNETYGENGIEERINISKHGGKRRRRM